MPQHPEDIDQLGPFYKKRFEELSDSPEGEVKDSLFEKMDMLEGKRAKTVYLHFNLFGMKIAASITAVIFSSLALMAVAAVTVIAVRNNRAKVKEEWMPNAPREENTEENTLSPSAAPSQTEEALPSLKEPMTLDTVSSGHDPKPETLPISPELPTPENRDKQESPIEATPLDKKGDNSKLLREVDEEEDLFKK